MDTKLAYLAGLVDGEGTISVFFDKTASTFTLRLHIYNSNEGLIDWCVENFGFHKSAQKPKKVNHKVVFQASLRGVKAKELIIKIEPFLVAKLDHAREVMTFPLKRRGGVVGYTGEEWQLRQRVCQTMHRLNQRGVHA